jgi:hypothetical protein
MRAPTDDEIMQAEKQVTEARREFSAARSRANVAFHDALVKPGTLLGVAGASALLGYYVFKQPASQPRRRGKPSSSEAPSTTATAATAAVASTSMAGIVMAFVMRYVMQQLPGIGMGIVRQAIRHRGGAGTTGTGAVRPDVTMH